jgi:ApaG protein
MTADKRYECSVTVKTEFLPDQSDLQAGRYAFSYHITITNMGTVAAQLISRHWVITDAEKRVQEVRGLGVVGEQPLLQNAASFEYVSGTVLNTAVGTMHGSYQFTAVDGTQFEVAIPTFTLTMPRVLH